MRRGSELIVHPLTVQPRPWLNLYARRGHPRDALANGKDAVCLVTSWAVGTIMSIHEGNY